MRSCFIHGAGKNAYLLRVHYASFGARVRSVLWQKNPPAPLTLPKLYLTISLLGVALAPVYQR